ncbi:abhydrolase domain-containing protein 11 [Trypanosoma grayi]|uniref:abhydrolase domain-containing protein 11 n=1 Tax=Trypanosoma grayi TaxID=71804 RepID=UPI0004F4358D|nr:abhydrolase domain-containing protein 11 [Trypanosoma grayi]KEG09537.1 abhydrolase domain-containing protein 11 [Trypanosoma grayi]
MASPVRLHSSKVSAPASLQQLPPIHFILLHGFLSHGNSFLSLAQQLQKQCAAELPGQRVEAFTIDCRNHGRSPHTLTHRLDELVLDLQAWLKHESYDSAHSAAPPTVVAVGHSMGALTWTKYLMDQQQQQPKRQHDAERRAQVAIAGLVSLDMPPLTKRLLPPSLEAELHEYIHLMKSVNLSAIKDMRSAEVEFVRCGIEDKRVRGFFTTNLNIVRTGSRANPRVSWRCNIPVLEESLRQRSVFLPDAFPQLCARCRIEVPVLSILGGASPVGGSNKYRGLWPNCATVVEEHVLPNAGHNLFYDDVEGTVRLVVGFARRLGIQHGPQV